MATFSRIKTWVSNEVLTAADLNAEFDNVINNITPSGVEDASQNVAAMQATVDPGGVGTESLATNLLGEIQRLRFVIKRIVGAQWYSYAGRSLVAGDLKIKTADIDDTQITTAKIADDAVETVKIKDAAVTTEKLADEAVETAKIANGAVTFMKLAPANRVRTDLFPLSVNSTTWTTVGEVVFTTGDVSGTDKPVDIFIYGDYFSTPAAAGVYGQIRIYNVNDSVPVNQWQVGGLATAFRIPIGLSYSLRTLAPNTAVTLRIEASLSSGSTPFSWSADTYFEVMQR